MGCVVPSLKRRRNLLVVQRFRSSKVSRDGVGGGDAAAAARSVIGQVCWQFDLRPSISSGWGAIASRCWNLNSAYSATTRHSTLESEMSSVAVN